MSGPLTGLKIIEMAGIGPVPFAAMVLADQGAKVLRIARPGTVADVRDVTSRGKSMAILDLREDGATEKVLDLAGQADILLEGFRPGVMERLGLGPDACHARNPALVYGRMTGWGQTGPLSRAAGHDLNYIAISGALHAMGRAGEPPAPPLNLVGDYGGGGMLLAMGVLSALHERSRSGKGQVVDAAMSDGAALLTAALYGMRATGDWLDQRGANLIDGGAHFYDTYACADGRYVAIGAIEPQFYALLRELCGIDEPLFDGHMDRKRWPLLKLRMADIFRTRTRDEWCAILEGTDACFAPVLDWDEAPRYPHNVARTTFVTVDGVTQPAPAPRFSRTPSTLRNVTAEFMVDDAMAAWGVAAREAA